MEEWTRKTVCLLGLEGVQKLREAHVAVVGIGGVGAFAAEFLARAGVGHLLLVDGDVVSESNRNRQLVALQSTQGQPKVDVMAARIRDINPEADVQAFQLFLTEDSALNLLRLDDVFARTGWNCLDAVADAIDSVGPKVALLAGCVEQGIPVVSAMGAAGKMDPARIRTVDISRTSVCPLAKKVRHELSAKGIRQGVAAVFSDEPAGSDFFKAAGRQNAETVAAIRNAATVAGENAVTATGECTATVAASSAPKERYVPGTVSYMPAAFGGQMAAWIIQKLTLYGNDSRN